MWRRRSKVRREREHPGDEMAGDWSVIEVRVEPVHLRETSAIDNRAEPTEIRNVARAVGGRGAVELHRRSDKRHTPQQKLGSRAQLAGRTVRFARGVGDGLCLYSRPTPVFQQSLSGDGESIQPADHKRGLKLNA